QQKRLQLPIGLQPWEYPDNRRNNGISNKNNNSIGNNNNNMSYKKEYNHEIYYPTHHDLGAKAGVDLMREEESHQPYPQSFIPLNEHHQMSYNPGEYNPYLENIGNVNSNNSSNNGSGNNTPVTIRFPRNI